MSNIVFNVAKGRIPSYCQLPQANDALIAIPLMASGLAGDSSLVDYTNLNALLSGTTDEQTVMGRKTLATVTNTVDFQNDRAVSDFADPVWVAATGPQIGALLICYVPDTTLAAGTTLDTSIIPMTKHDFVVTPNGGDITAIVSSTGFYYST